MSTYALMDSGSTQSFCSEDLMRRIGIHAKRETMKLTTLDQKEVEVNTFIVSLEMADYDDSHLFVMPNVLTRPKLNIGLGSLVTREELDRWPHLRSITVT